MKTALKEIVEDLILATSLISLLCIYIAFKNGNRKNRRAGQRQKSEKPKQAPVEQQNTELLEIEKILQQKEEQSVKKKEQQQLYTENKAKVQTKKTRLKGDGIVHHDDDGHTVIHRENESRQHDKGKLYVDKKPEIRSKSKEYYDSHSDYSYDEEQMNAETAAFSAAIRNKSSLETGSRRRRFRKPALVNGLVMAQLLGKPRALNPYDDNNF